MNPGQFATLPLFPRAKFDFNYSHFNFSVSPSAESALHRRALSAAVAARQPTLQSHEVTVDGMGAKVLVHRAFRFTVLTHTVHAG